MDHVVHINNGSEAKPIVLRLLPGEETLFNLKIVNHGEPSNISLEASDPVFKAVRLKKPDHYVVMEEIIPVMARMPSNVDRLDGELLLTSGAGESRVPISLRSEAEDPGDDLEEPGERRDEDLGDDLGVEEEEDEEEEGWEEEASTDSEDLEDADKEQDAEPEEEGREARRIEFSRHRDLQSYKAASRPRRMEAPREARIEEPVDEPDGETIDDTLEDRIVIGQRIEDRAEERIEDRTEGRREPQGYQGGYRDYGTDSGRSSPEPRPDAEMVAEAEEDGYEERKAGLLGVFGGGGALQIIPLGILLALIFMLVMTFITESIPEFPGALASSILIVTLIIYGAATLLKA